MSLAGLAAVAPVATADEGDREVTITDVTFQNQEFEDLTSQRLVVDWTLSEGDATGPVTIEMDLPPELEGPGESYPIYGPDGTQAGTITVTSDKVTVVIDEAFVQANPAEISGEFFFNVQVELNNRETVEKTFDFGNIEETVTVRPSSRWCVENCAWDRAWAGKWGSYDRTDETIVWGVQVPAPNTGTPVGSQITVTDDLPGQDYRIISDGQYPRIVWANTLVYNEFGQEVPRWQYPTLDWQSGPDATWNDDYTSVTFEARQGRPGYSNGTPGEIGSERGLDGEIYFVQWHVEPLTGGEVINEYGDRVFHNAYSYEVEGYQSGGQSGTATRYAAGGNVVGTNFGKFTITKELLGDTILDPDFEITYTVTEPGQDPETVTDTIGDGDTHTSIEYYRGSTVTLTEIAPTDPDNVDWEAPEFSWTDPVTGEVQTITELPWTFTIGDNFPVGQLTDITLTNEATLQRGSVELSKELLNPDGLEITQDSFTVDYEWPADPERGIAAGNGSVDLPANGDVVTVDDLPVGANVTFTERAPNAVDNATWTVEIIEGTVVVGDEPVGVKVINSLTRHTYAIGDYTWIDTDRDGVQDDGEPVLPGVTVHLYTVDADGVRSADPVATTTTDENGLYLFDTLRAGDYQVQFVLTDEQAATYIFTSYTTGDDAELDSDAGVDGFSAVVTLDDDNAALTTEYTDQTVEATHGIDQTWDAGVIVPAVSVGDYVWVDTDRDGLQDDGEPGIPGVVLTVVGPDGEPVRDVNGEPVGPQTTDENGEYSFDLLPVLEEGESYTVIIDREASAEPLAPYVPTLDEQGDDRAIDSSTWEATSWMPLTEDGDRDPTLDFGFVIPAVSAGDYVWVDTDRDGLQDDGEPGIPGVVLTVVGPDGEPVRDVNGEPVGPQITDENGEYSFDLLPVLEEGESYTVIIDREASAEPLAPYVPTLDEQGDDRAIDSSTWETASIAQLTENLQHDPTLDFGFVLKTYAIGDYVWIDTDRDGVQDEDEPVLPGVTVHLYTVDADGVRSADPVATTTTDENGLYLFDDLLAGQYQVQFVLTDEQAEIYGFTGYLGGSDPAVDSNAGESGFSAVIVLDEDNTFLSTDYDAQPFSATQGVDPTWDAGVVLLPVPEEPTDPTDPGRPSQPGDPDLPRTGGIAVGAAAAGLLLVLFGTALIIARRRATEV